MAPIKAFFPPNVAEDEHVIRRLGWAVIRQWCDLPSNIQDLLREQAVFTEDRHPTTVQLNEEISAFINRHSKSDSSQV